MRGLFKEKEFDKISYELLNEVYPMEGLNNYYFLGCAAALDTLEQIIDDDTITKEDLKRAIKHYTETYEKIGEFYSRLKKDRE